MNIWTAVEKQFDENAKKYARGKAREDLNLIFNQVGINEIEIIAPQGEREKANKIKKFLYHYQAKNIWNRSFDKIENGGTLILQFPVINHSLFLKDALQRVKRRGVKIVAFIHDLEILRLSNAENVSILEKWRMRREEVDELLLFDYLVVHNERMKVFLHNKFNIPNEKMIVLQIFDYLLPAEFTYSEILKSKKEKCIIAGNLSRQKVGYVYNLPISPKFELYGINYVYKEEKENVHYHGSYLADELPFYLEGDFGLVWDGADARTCSGAWGEYLRYNNPHKASLYLACGIPVIIWEQAALADFINTNCVGFSVSSLDEITEKINLLSDEQYRKMKMNAVNMAKKLRVGYYTKNVLTKLDI